MSTTEISRNKPLYSCRCKGSDTAPLLPITTRNWALPRRAKFEILEDRIQCGDWVIPYSEVKKNTVYKTKQWPFSFSLIHLETDNRTFQFAFSKWANPAKQLPLDFTEENVKLKNSPYIVCFRIALYGYLAFEAWKYMVTT